MVHLSVQAQMRTDDKLLIQLHQVCSQTAVSFRFQVDHREMVGISPLMTWDISITLTITKPERQWIAIYELGPDAAHLGPMY
jgi:hypothetical protein